MREMISKIGRIRSTHPEMKGQELDAIPVRARTVRRLNNTIGRRVATNSFSEVTLPGKTYNVVRVTQGDTRVAITEQPPKEGGTSVTYNLRPREGGKGLEIIKREPVNPALPAADAIPEGVVITDSPVLDAYDEAMEEAHRATDEMAKVTGLPEVSEGETRRLIRDMRSGSIKRLI